MRSCVATTSSRVCGHPSPFTPFKCSLRFHPCQSTSVSNQLFWRTIAIPCVAQTAATCTSQTWKQTGGEHVSYSPDVPSVGARPSSIKPNTLGRVSQPLTTVRICLGESSGDLSLCCGFHIQSAMLLHHTQVTLSLRPAALSKTVELPCTSST